MSNLSSWRLRAWISAAGVSVTDRELKAALRMYNRDGKLSGTGKMERISRIIERRHSDVKDQPPSNPDIYPATNTETTANTPEP